MDNHFFNSNYKTLVINSNDLNENNIYNLPEEIEYSGVRLSQLLFANSFYNIDETNNSFKIIQKNNLNVLKPFEFQIPVGLYDSTSYCTALATQLNSAAAASAFIVGTFTVSVNSTTLRMTISNPDANNDFILDTPTNGGSHYDLIGYTTLSSVYGKSQVSNQSVNFSDRHTVLLRSNDLGPIFGDVFHSSFPSDNSLMHVAINLGSPLSWVSSSPNSQSFYRISRHGANAVNYLNRLHLEVIDSNGKKLNFNGIPFYCILEFM